VAELWTIRRVLDWTAADLGRRGVSAPRLDAEVLLAHALGSSRLALFLDMDRPLSDAERTAYRRLVERRRAREPLAYITGEREFWSRPIGVDPRVLVPRPETETLVAEALALVRGSGAALVVDVGTGSGCVAIAIASEAPAVHVAAVDLSPDAASLASRNAAANGVAAQVHALVGDLLGPVRGPVDLVVSNPPYIPSSAIDRLEPEVARFEPRLALDGGPDGLDVYRRLIPAAAEVLAAGGALALEVGHDEQADQVAGLVEHPLAVERVARDHAGTARVVVARREARPPLTSAGL